MNYLKFSTVSTILVISLFGCAPLSAAYVLNFFPASDYSANTSTMNTTLGISGYQIDSFESTTLLPGLTISMSGDAVTTPITWASLPNLYNVNSLGVTENNEWEGTNAVANNPLNQITSASSTDFSKIITFNYASGTTSFGIGLSNFQSTDSPSFPITNHDLFVNGVDLGTIETLAGSNWSPGLVRNAYLVVDATNGSVISSVGFQNNSGADALLFDHLAVQSVPEPASWLLLGVGGFVLCWLRRSPTRNAVVE